MDARHAHRKLLVLDLDETLIYADECPLDRAADFEIPPYHVYLRPGVAEFLAAVSRHYRLAVWTSSSPAYAQAVCEDVFGDRFDLDFIWASDPCTPTRDFTLDIWAQSKRLKKLKRLGYTLEHVIVVDDSSEKHTNNYGTLVQVAPFHGDQSDQELAILATYLHQILDVENVRAVEKRHWRHRIGTQD